jgi:catechol 2,3-dioxygenase-like lactoylglutathione lyase family enzyme
VTEANPSIMSHVSIGANNVDASLRFYDRALAPLGARRILEHPGAVAYGKQYPEFWVHAPHDGKAASVGNGTHFGFFAANKQAVDEFYRAALDAGAQDEGPPGPRKEYGAPYYGCFVRDPDGHKIEAAFWDFSMAQP